jgi:Uma2 family endonuclease
MAMNIAAEKRMSVDEFIVWAQARPGRWELLDGVPVAMAPERLLHGDTKYRAAKALEAAIAAAGVRCRFVLDSALVRIDEQRACQPDALVYCGPPLPDDAFEVPAPVIVVEVLSPSNALSDLRDKLLDYFLVPSIRHYLIVDADRRLVIHHERAGEGAVTTRVLRDGSLRLDPPGLTLALADLLPAATR